MTHSPVRLPIALRLSNYLRHALSRVTGRQSELQIELAGEPVKLAISNAREIRRAHAIHHELDFVERIREHLAEGDTIFDIGANIGVLTLLMARHPNSVRSTLYSFEPEPRNFTQLQQNIALNGLQSRVIPKQIALGASDGQASLHVRGEAGEGRHSIAESSGATDAITVALTTCESFARQENAMPNVLKIDVEGAEGQVLSGVTGLLDSNAPRDIFLEIHNKGDRDNMPDGTLIHDWFENHNYKMVWNVERRSGEHRHYRHSSAQAA